MDAELELRVNGCRQSVDARALREVRHDEVVGRHGKGEQEGRGDAGAQLRQDDLAEGLERRCAEIERGLVADVVESHDLRQDAEHRVGQVDDDVRHEDRVVAEAQAEAEKQQHQRDARDDVGVEERHIREAAEDELALLREIADGKRRDEPQERRKERSRQADRQCVEKCLNDVLAREELLVPLQGEARPLAAVAARIERLRDEDKDWRVEENDDDAEIDFLELCHHESTSCSFALRSEKASTTILRMMKTMRIIERALPSCQS